MFKLPPLSPDARGSSPGSVPKLENHVYCLIGNIPSTFHSADLRNYFSSFVESEKFDCFHFRHRPQLINISIVKEEPSSQPTTSASSNVNNVEKQTLCSIVRFCREDWSQEFVLRYHGKYWMDKAGNELQGRSVIQKVKVSQEEVQKFSKELRPPQIMPRGNVGTSTAHFLNLIKECRLPPSLVKKLGLEFPRARSYKRYSKVPFNYGTRIVEAEEIEEEVLTAKGHVLSDLYVERKQVIEDTENWKETVDSENEDNDPNADDDRCEDWERHEGLNDDVTSQERLKERLYEDEIELVWEKGGPGIVWYTDAQFWDAQKGGFDERTADDLDVDMEGYYVPGAGDKDARDSLEIRRSQRFQKGLEEVSVFKKHEPKPRQFRSASPPTDSQSTPIGTFESYTKGIGRKVMESQGWTEGRGLGKWKEGIKEALLNDGQPPLDKSGLGYFGEKIEFTRKRRRPKHSHAANDHGLDEDGRVVIGTIYDNPTDLDREETNLRSNTHTFIKRYSIPSTSKLVYNST